MDDRKAHKQLIRELAASDGLNAWNRMIESNPTLTDLEKGMCQSLIRDMQKRVMQDANVISVSLQMVGISEPEITKATTNILRAVYAFWLEVLVKAPVEKGEDQK